MKKIAVNNLKVDNHLLNFINDEAIPHLGIDIKKFWDGFDKVVHELVPINRRLLKKRREIQKKISEWHLSKKGTDINKKQYFTFLKSIGYIFEEKEEFKISTSNVDQEITSVAGPQLVVPVDNARYALNAANARWGSLYDALYGTDTIPGERGNAYSSERGNEVISYVREFLDNVVPINKNNWKEVSKIEVEQNNLILLFLIQMIITFDL